jgi:hypothetical protein
MDPMRATGLLMTAAGVLFVVAGLLLQLREPVWLVLGAALIVLGTLVRRRGRRG